MKRRAFITLLGGAAAGRSRRARSSRSVPVIGMLNANRCKAYMATLARFRQGLQETGYIEARTWRSNIAGPRTMSVVCRSWRPNWLPAGRRDRPLEVPSWRWRPRRQPRPFPSSSP